MVLYPYQSAANLELVVDGLSVPRHAVYPSMGAQRQHPCWRWSDNRRAVNHLQAWSKRYWSKESLKGYTEGGSAGCYE